VNVFSWLSNERVVRASEQLLSREIISDRARAITAISSIIDAL